MKPLHPSSGRGLARFYCDLLTPRWPTTWLSVAMGACMWVGVGVAQAEPWQPRSDQEVVETLPLASAARKEAARAQHALQQSPTDGPLAVAAAARYLALAREQGDARYAGLALGALRAWPAGQAAPTEVLVMRATVSQYLHDFDGAAALLRQALLQDPRHAQAWLTLATVRRVQARLADADAACGELVRLGQAMHGRACLAENQSLRGEHEAARQALVALIDAPAVRAASGAGMRQWLLTTLAEAHERAGQAAQAQAAWQQALALGPHPYVQMAYADFLLQQGRAAEVLALLKGQTENDAALLRLCIAGRQLQLPQAEAWVKAMQERLSASASRPGGAQVHAREQARFALHVLRQPEQALSLARQNLSLQRESADLLVFAQAADAQPRADLAQAARQELAQWTQTWGMQDARLSK